MVSEICPYDIYVSPTCISYMWTFLIERQHASEREHRDLTGLACVCDLTSPTALQGGGGGGEAVTEGVPPTLTHCGPSWEVRDCDHS